MPADSNSTPVLKVALPLPLPRTFDYGCAAFGAATADWIGCRVRVTFGARRLVGVVAAIGPADSEREVRDIDARLDAAPLLTGEIWHSLEWAARYYAHPLGEVLAAAMPAWLERGHRPDVRPQALELTVAGRAALAETPPRAASAAAELLGLVNILGVIARAQWTQSPALARAVGRWRKLGWLAPADVSVAVHQASPPVSANEAQQSAIDSVLAHSGFGTFLLDGVTGSGKTEVYLRLIEAQLARHRQSLVLVPEIGLTPQLLARLEARLRVPIGVLHSGLASGARARVWHAVAEGRIDVLVGTRSAVFVPLPRAGLIVIDEEHDASFKQQEGFRYHARDLAIVRAQALDVPIVLGSATPSLESLANVAQSRYQRLVLPERAGGAQPPRVTVLDLRAQPLREGLPDAARAALAACLARGEQALVFRNRRGFAPVLMCHDCGWFPACERCSTSETERRALTWHHAPRALRCHHCGVSARVPQHCANCGGLALVPTGFGTQRLESALVEFFPDARVVRIDADSTRTPGSFATLIAPLVAGEPGLLVGTQMLAKGHDLPLLTLAVVLGVDAPLTAADFRAPERLAQLLIQVSGRVGRGSRPGRVLLPTHQPLHPLLTRVLQGGYGAFAEFELAQRRAAGLPPFASQALLRAEAKSEQPVDAFLRAAMAAGATLAPGNSKAHASTGEHVRAFGPLPAPQPRRAGFVRAQILIESARRADLQAYLQSWVPLLYGLPSARRVRWSIDVDPVDWA